MRVVKSSRRILKLLTVLLVILSAIPAVAQEKPPSITEETWNFLTQAKWSQGPQALADIKNPDVRIAIGWRRVLTKDITPQQFYAEMRTLDLGGQQLRGKLVEVKTRLMDVLGPEAAQHFLGEIYVLDRSELTPDAGAENQSKPMGSEVEDMILGWRSELYDRTKSRSLRRLAQEFAGDPRKFSAFFADIGSRPTGPGAPTFAGDLDGNLITAYLELGRRFLEIWDEEIRAATGGLGGVDIDLVATVLGMSGPEVYAGEAGRIKAVELILEGKARNIQEVDLETGRLGREVGGRHALREVALQGGLAGIEIPETGDVKLPPAGPAVIFEMARHLDRDVLRHLQFEDMESFLKIAKFIERASGEAARAGRPLDSDLVVFSKELSAAKDAGDYIRATEAIHTFFGNDMPVDVELGRSRGGKSPLTIVANRKFVSDFGERCLKELMSTGNAYLADEIKAVRERVQRLKSGTGSPTEVAADLAKLRDAMEVERLVLEHPAEGLRTMDPKVVSLVDDLGKLSQSFMQDNWQAVLPEHLKRQRRFVEEIMSRDGEVNRQLAAATIAYTPEDALTRGLEVVEGINNLLDSLDSTLFGPLRGEVDWLAMILKGHEASYATRAGIFLDVDISGTSLASYLSDLEKYNIGVEIRMNALFFDNCVARRIQEANNKFSEFVKQSDVAVAGLKALTAIQLADELPAYWKAFDQESLEEGWSALAATILERRVPGVTLIQHVEAGSIGLACVDFATIIFPPTAMGYAIWGMGNAMGEKSWDYWWSSELGLFGDTLYASATWEPAGVERVGNGIDIEKMKLKSVTYQGQVIVIDEYLAEKSKQIGEMQAAMRVPYKDRRFPYEHVTSDPFLGWLGADDMLRENLARVDNVLLVIDAEKKQTFVGKKSKYADQLHQVWTLRWEQVKVAYLAQLIGQLEGRAENEGHGLQRLAEVLLELYEVTEKLKVTDQVFASLGKESGSEEAAEWTRWFYDFLVTGKRAAFEQAAAESKFTKANRVALDYLEVYTAVLETRAAAETLFVSDEKPAEDSGLRILSTPFLLACRADRDKTEYRRSATMPIVKLREIDSELSSIKKAFVPGGGLDPAADSFDQKTLRAMTYHDVFKELWKTVQVASHVVQGSVTNLNFRLWWELSKQRAFGDNPELHAAADAGLDSITGANEIAGIGSADLPLERFRYHDTERDRLALEFLEHYLDRDGRLNGMVARAEELAQQIRENCDRASAEIDAVRIGAETLSAHAADLERSLAAVTARLDEIASLLDAIGRFHADAETAATAVAEAAVEAERLSLEICDRLRRVQTSADPDLRHQLMAEMRTLDELLDDQVEIGDDGLAAVEEAARNARTAFSDVDGVLEELDLIEEAAASVGDGSDLVDRLAAAAAALDRIIPIFDQLDEVREDAVDTMAAVVAALEEFTENADTVNLAARVEASVDRIVELVDEAKGTDLTESCWVIESTMLTEVQTRLDDAMAEVRDADGRLAAAITNADASADRVDLARSDTESAEYLAELAGDYRERLQTLVDAARLCVELARDLFSRETVPDVIGRPLAEAQRVLAAAGLQPTTQGGSPAPSTELAYSVEAQSPAPGEQVPGDGVVTLLVYGPSGTIRVPAVHGLAAAGARSAIEGAGLVAAFVAGSAAASPGEAFTVDGQDPAAGALVRRGDTVTVRVLGAFDVAAATRGVDCSSWPGAVAVWDQASGGPKCVCPTPSTWSGPDGRCVAGTAVAAAQQVADPCAERDSVFWRLMMAQRLDEARDVLLQSQDCDFYSRGVGALQNEVNAICETLSAQILQACVQGNLPQAQALIQEASRRRCRVSQDAYQCIERNQRIQRQQQTQQQWGQIFGMVNQITQQIQQEQLQANGTSGGGRSGGNLPVPSNPTLPIYPVGGLGGWTTAGTVPVGGGTSGGGTGPTTGGGGGRSQQDCERQYCSMCFNDVDLLGVSVDSQCNECRRVNAANIRACMEGGNAGPAVATTATYRLVCRRNRADTEGCDLYSCLNPTDVKGAYDTVVGTYHSWDSCYQQSSAYTGYGR